MVFIEGVGYVNDSSAVATPNRTQSVSETTPNFVGMLRTETDKLNQASVTTNLDSIFKEAANKYGVSERLLKAIAYTESGFQANATSSSGAMGIMQLMPSTASAYGVSDPYDAYQNIMGGAAVLKDLLNMFQGNQSLAIAGYNAGCGNVKKYGGVPPFTETQNYVAKVTSLMQTGVSVPANTVTVNPSANTSSNTGTATSEYFNTSNEATVSSETAKKNAEILAEIKEIISAISTLTTNQSTYSNTSMQSGLSALNGTSASDFSAGSLLSSYGNPISTILSSLQNVDTTDTDSLQKVLSYAEYQLLTSHYTNMVDIISVLGSTGLSTENDSDDSLSHLFELATQQNMRKVINVMGLIRSSCSRSNCARRARILRRSSSISRCLCASSCCFSEIRSFRRFTFSIIS